MISPGDWERLHAPGPWREVGLRCPECGCRWWIEAREEYGCTVLADEDESRCPECEEEAQ